MLGLKLSDTRRPLTSDSRTNKTPNDVVLEGIEHQIELIKNPDWPGVERIRYSGTGEDATKQVKMVRPRPWFWTENGTYMLQLRYGASHIIEILEGKPTIHCGKTPEDVAKVFSVVVDGIKSGKLNGPIAAAANKAKRKSAT